jgi:RNA polymerase sigma factor (sigma-70 family)
MGSNLISPDEPVTLWIRQLERGESQAAQPLWDHFCRRLMELAGQQLPSKLRRSYDEEDAAVSAFHSLCRVISERKTSDLSDRFNLWKLLVTITERKITNRLRDERRGKRDVRRTFGESCFINLDGMCVGLDALPGREPTPDFAATFADLCDYLLASLDNEKLRAIAQLKLEYRDTAEIAKELGCTRRTVERKLLIIRARWEKRMGHAGSPS